MTGEAKEKTMSKEEPVRLAWLKGMYLYNVVATGGAGLLFLGFPGTVQSMFKFPPQEPAVFAIYGSVLLAFALVCLAALRAPVRFSAVLLMQVAYKVIWVAAVALPLFVRGRFPFYAVGMAGIYATYIIGDLIAIPFGLLFPARKVRGTETAAGFD